MKLPENFEKEYFSLLTPVVTDGTVKNRRNLLVSAFSVSLLYFLDKSLSELSILGIKLEGTDGKAILIAAFVLILFWFLMFCIHSTKDAQINKERRHLLIKYAEELKERLEYMTETYQNHEDGHPNKQQIGELEKEYNIFLQQKKRTGLANRLALGAFVIEYALPLIVGGWCLFQLVTDMFSVW